MTIWIYIAIIGHIVNALLLLLLFFLLSKSARTRAVEDKNKITDWIDIVTVFTFISFVFNLFNSVHILIDLI